MLRHVVFFNWKEETTEAEKQAVEAGLGALPARIPQIRRYEIGRDLGLADGNFDFALVADFDSIEDYEVYQAHPEHQRVIRESIKPVISQRAAVQYRLDGPAGA